MSTSSLICIVDDNADYLTLLNYHFRRWLPAYKVRCFVGGQAFLDELPHLQPTPGLILLDCHMPGLNGHQTLLQLRHHWATLTTPIVMMSAMASPEERQDCYRSGANSFLDKPVDTESMQTTLALLCHYWLEVNQ